MPPKILERTRKKSSAEYLSATERKEILHSRIVALANRVWTIPVTEQNAGKFMGWTCLLPVELDRMEKFIEKLAKEMEE